MAVITTSLLILLHLTKNADTAIGIQLDSIDIGNLLPHKVLLIPCRTSCTANISALYLGINLSASSINSLHRQTSVVGQIPPKRRFLYLHCLGTGQPVKTSCIPLNSVHLTHQLKQPKILRHLLPAGQGSAVDLPHHLSRPHFFLTIYEQRTLSHQRIYFTADITPVSSSHIIYDGRVNLFGHA